MNTRSFVIPASNKSMVEQKIEKLNKRATKLDLEPIVLTWGKAYTEQDEILLPCELTGPLSVSYDGWEFIATLQHLPTGENIIRAITDEYEIPLEYRESGSACEHCHVNRYRKDTYVVRHDATCEARQVGSTCIKDFLGGNSPDNIMQKASFIGDLISFMQGARISNQGHDENIFYINNVLAHTSACIRGYGWISKAEASRTGALATAMLVESNMRGDNTYIQYPVTQEDKDLAKEAAEWAENLSDEEVEASDYLYNIRAIARSGMVGFRTIGYAASIVSSFMRNNSPRTTKHESDFVGTLKQRDVFKLLAKKVSGFTGPYGYTNKYVFQDDSGNIMIWLTSTEQPIKEGKQYAIKGTIKAHHIYNDVKETIISRCEILN